MNRYLYDPGTRTCGGMIGGYALSNCMPEGARFPTGWFTPPTRSGGAM
jgi:hypothetical protein